MRLDPRHFNRFMAITAVFSMAAIAWFTIRHQRVQQAAFESSVRTELPTWWARAASDPQLLPTLGLPADRHDATPFEGSTRVIVFWAPWSERSIAVLQRTDGSLRDFADGGMEPVRLVALGVKDAPEAMRDVANSSDFIAIWLDGTKAYADLGVPGVPTMIVLDPSGAVSLVDVGIDPGRVEEALKSVFR